MPLYCTSNYVHPKCTVVYPCVRWRAVICAGGPEVEVERRHTPPATRAASGCPGCSIDLRKVGFGLAAQGRLKHPCETQPTHGGNPEYRSGPALLGYNVNRLRLRYLYREYPPPLPTKRLRRSFRNMKRAGSTFERFDGRVELEQ